MGKGIEKREKKRRRLVKWGAHLLALEEVGHIASPTAFARARLGDGAAHGAVQSLAAVVSNLVEPAASGGFQIMPSKLTPAIEVSGARVVVERARLAALGPPPDRPPPVPEEEPAPEPEDGGSGAEYALLSICKLTLAEALALLAECDERGNLPDFFASGFQSRIGPSAWGVLKRNGLVDSTGPGRAAISAPHTDEFEWVRFTVWSELGRRHQRWSDVPDDLAEDREPGTWCRELKIAVERLAAEQAAEEARARLEATTAAEKAARDALTNADLLVQIRLTTARLGRLIADNVRTLERGIKELERELKALRTCELSEFGGRCAAVGRKLAALKRLKNDLPRLRQEQQALEIMLERLPAIIKSAK